MDENKATLTLVYESLKEDIMSGDIPQGTKINQRELAQKFNISRTPVIKALHLLVSDGLVDSTNNKGFSVHITSVKELSELFILREAVDTIAVSDLLRVITPEQTEELRSLFKDFDVESPDFEIDKYREADIIFHNRIIEMCSNDLIKRLNYSFQILNRTYVAGILRSPTETLKEHLMIIEGLSKKESEETITAVKEHIRITKNNLLKLVDRMTWLGLDPSRIPIDEIDMNKK